VIGVPVDNRSRRCARSHLANAARPIGRNQNRPDVLRRHRPAADSGGRTDEPVNFSVMCWCEGSKEYLAADERR
jgi:hypothetical protein